MASADQQHRTGGVRTQRFDVHKPEKIEAGIEISGLGVKDQIVMATITYTAPELHSLEINDELPDAFNMISLDFDLSLS